MMLTPEISTPAFFFCSFLMDSEKKNSWAEPRDDHTTLLWHNAEGEGLWLLALIGSPDANLLLEPSV